MSFSEMAAYGEQNLLAQFGEPVILEHELAGVTVTAVVDLQSEKAEPLMPGNSRQGHTLTMSAENAAMFGPEWTAIVRGERFPVLETVPAGSGMSIIWLGDAEVDPYAL